MQKNKFLKIAGLVSALIALAWTLVPEISQAESPAYALVERHSSQRPIPLGQEQVVRRNPGFEVPAKIRARVDFWVDIFTRYGKNQVVIHHRDFPQAVFSVLDFTREAEYLNPVQLEKLRKRTEAEEMASLKEEFKRLAVGAASGKRAEKIEAAMRLVPGGRSKYLTVVSDDLIRSQTGIREKYGEAIKRSGRYIHFIEHIFVRDFGLPVELTRLPFIESSFDYQAYSAVGAAGIWQFMRGTGRKYLTINNLLDERRDIHAATRAAAKYFQHAYSTLGTWPLSVTSYNHGIAGVYRKVKSYGSTDLATIIEDPSDRIFGFASSNFYPEFLAALEVYEKRAHYFPDIQEERAVSPYEVRLTRPVTVTSILRQYPSLSLSELQSLNFAVSDTIWRGRYPLPAGYTLKLPERYSGHAPEYAAAPGKESAPPLQASSVYGGITYKIRKGDTLLSIAKRYGASVSEIMELNKISSAKTLKIGKVITVKERSTPAPKRVVVKAKVSTTGKVKKKRK